MSCSRLRNCCRAAALLLGVLDAYCTRHYLNADGVSYLDIGDAYFRGDWHNAVNSYWSPLYSWLVGGALALLRPSAYWQFAAVKLVNLVIYLGSLLAFEWLLTELLLLRRSRPLSPDEKRLPEWADLLFGYALFVSGSQILIWLGLVSPDLCVSLVVYLIAALLTRGRRLGWRPASSALLGLLLGIGYLAKTALLPLGAVFLAVSALSVSGRRALMRLLALSGVLWIAIAGYWIAVISMKMQRFAFGDSSTLNYLWNIDGVELFRWRTDDASLGRPLHPPREVFAAPPVFEFAEPVSGTYPLWYDPPYWFAGLSPRFRMDGQLDALAKSTGALLEILFTSLGVFTAGVAVLYYLAWSTCPQRRFRLAAVEYQLLVPALAAFGMYSLVYVEGRYVAPFLVLLFLALLEGIRWNAAADAVLRRWTVGVVGLACLAVLAMDLSTDILQEGLLDEGPQANVHWAVARCLADGGVGPGDHVGVIGDAFECGWARLAGVRITSQVLEGGDTQTFWSAGADQQQQVLEAFRRTGVAAVVARWTPGPGSPWVHVGDSNFYVFYLAKRPE